MGTGGGDSFNQNAGGGANTGSNSNRNIGGSLNVSQIQRAAFLPQDLLISR
jgi:hypothetical protein